MQAQTDPDLSPAASLRQLIDNPRALLVCED